MSNSAIQILEQRLVELTEGMYSISSQTEDLEKMHEQMKKKELHLAVDKRALVEIQAALAILKAGEE